MDLGGQAGRFSSTGHSNGRKLFNFSLETARTSAHASRRRRSTPSRPPENSILDGKLVTLDPEGRPSFSLMQDAGSNGAPIVIFSPWKIGISHHSLSSEGVNFSESV